MQISGKTNLKFENNLWICEVIQSNLQVVYRIAKVERRFGEKSDEQTERKSAE